MIQIDDIVKLNKSSKHYKKWSNYTFRVIDVKPEGNKKLIRIVRNMRNEKVGTTNHYIKEYDYNISIVKKNKNYIKAEIVKQETKDALKDLFN